MIGDASNHCLKVVLRGVQEQIRERDLNNHTHLASGVVFAVKIDCHAVKGAE